MFSLVFFCRFFSQLRNLLIPTPSSPNTKNPRRPESQPKQFRIQLLMRLKLAGGYAFKSHTKMTLPSLRRSLCPATKIQCSKEHKRIHLSQDVHLFPFVIFWPLYIIPIPRPSSGLLKSDLRAPPASPSSSPPASPSTCQRFLLCPLSDSETYSRLFGLPDAEETWRVSSLARDLLLSPTSRLWCDMYPV